MNLLYIWCEEAGRYIHTYIISFTNINQRYVNVSHIVSHCHMVAMGTKPTFHSSRI